MGCSQLVPTASLCLEHPTPGPQLAAQKWLSSSSSPHPIQTYPRFSSKSSEMRLLIDVTEASLLVPRGVVRHLDWKTRNWEYMSYRWFHLRACFEHSLARNRGGTTSQWKRHGHSTYSRPVVSCCPSVHTTCIFTHGSSVSAGHISNPMPLPRPRKRSRRLVPPKPDPNYRIDADVRLEQLSTRRG